MKSLLALACLSLSLWTAPAQGQVRSWGVGTAIGGGFSYNTIPNITPLASRWGPQADLGTLELRVFFAHGGSLDLYSQLGNTIISGILAAVPKEPDEEGVLFFLSLGLLYNFNLGTGKRRWLLGIGPEVGMDIGMGGRFLKTRPIKAHLRLASRVGVEFLFRGHRYGLQLMVRSFFEPLSYAGIDGKEASLPGFGALLELAFIAYQVQKKP